MSARDILQALIIAAKTPAALSSLAVELRELADELDARATAQRRQQAKPPEQRLKAGKGGRPSKPWIEVQHRARGDAGADTLIIRISTSLYYSAGSPERLDVQRVGAELRLIPARGDAGYKTMINAGGIRINASGARDVIALDAGKYAALLRGSAIVVGARMD